MDGGGLPLSPTLAQIGSSGRQTTTKVRDRNTPQDTSVCRLDSTFIESAFHLN